MQQSSSHGAGRRKQHHQADSKWPALNRNSNNLIPRAPSAPSLVLQRPHHLSSLIPSAFALLLLALYCYSKARRAHTPAPEASEILLLDLRHALREAAEEASRIRQNLEGTGAEARAAGSEEGESQAPPPTPSHSDAGGQQKTGAVTNGNSRPEAQETGAEILDTGGHEDELAQQASATQNSASASAPSPSAGGNCGALYEESDHGTGPGSFQRLTWNPQKDKFLLMYCWRGQISNRVLCMRSHLVLAALLNRTLILPHRLNEQFQRQYDISLAWDWERTKECLGANTIMTSEEYEQRHGRPVSVDRLHCWHGPARSCPNDPRRRDLDCPAMVHPGHAITTVEKEPNRTWSRPLFVDPQSHFQSLFVRNKEGMLAYGSCMDYHENFTDIVAEFGQFNDTILAVGDLVDRVVVFPELAQNPYLERIMERIFQRGEKCSKKSLHAPPDGLLERAGEIAAEIFGDKGREKYLSVHWRRGDFGWFCFQAMQSTKCFYPADQAANCTVREATKHGIRHVFLATNAPDEEVEDFLTSLNEQSGGQLEVKRFPKNVEIDQKWLQGENATAQRILVEVLLDKLVAAHARVFLGSAMSTFTEDIVSFRYGMGTLSCDDTFLCNGEEEWLTDTKLPEDFKREKEEWKVKRERLRREEEQRKQAEELQKLQEQDKEASGNGESQTE